MHGLLELYFCRSVSRLGMVQEVPEQLSLIADSARLEHKEGQNLILDGVQVLYSESSITGLFLPYEPPNESNLTLFTYSFISALTHSRPAKKALTSEINKPSIGFSYAFMPYATTASPTTYELLATT